MNVPRNITETIYTEYDYNIPEMLSEWLEDLAEAVAKVPEEFRSKVEIEIECPDDGGCARIDLTYTRPERMAEVALRERREEEYQQRNLVRAQQEIKRLQAILDAAKGADQ